MRALALFDLSTDEKSLLCHHTRRRAHNRLGFALQLLPSAIPAACCPPRETIPLEVVKFIAAQIGVQPDELASYAETDVTRRRSRYPRRHYVLVPGRSSTLRDPAGRQFPVPKFLRHAMCRFCVSLQASSESSGFHSTISIQTYVLIKNSLFICEFTAGRSSHFGMPDLARQ